MALAHAGENIGWLLVCSLSTCIFWLGENRVASHHQVEDVTEILIRHNVCGRCPKFWTATLVWAAYSDCRLHAMSDSRIFIGLSLLKKWVMWLVTWHSHLQSFATPPPRVAVRRREVIRHADGRGWEKMENVEFRNFPSMTSRKSYCISKIIIFETVSRWLTCDYSPRNNTMSHLLPAVIWWPSSRCICRCLLIGGKLNSIKFLWRYLKSWIKANDT